MSDHAAVKEEHRKLYRSLLTEGDPEWRIQLLADFARDERLKEAERVKAVAREHMFDGDYSRFEEQLKRGEA